MLFLTPPWLKEAHRLSKAVKKFLHHNKDLISDASMADALAMKAQFDEAVQRKDKQAVEDLKKPLSDTCEKAVPGYKSDSYRENVEVIIVAIIVALGIRAYYLQPFKIPTASMQPTLNGIVSTPMKSSAEFPNIAVRAFEYAWRGRNYTEVKAPEGMGPVQIVNVAQSTKLHFFTTTTITWAGASGGQKEETVYAPAGHLFGRLWLQEARIPVPQADAFNAKIPPGGPFFQPGTVVACGHIDTGDQLLVDKVSYNFRQPKRGEVFVFTTAGITMPNVPSQYGSQHYIKRLVGVPGDNLELKPADGGGAELWINGERAKEPGMVKVMSKQDGYPGYTFAGGPNAPFTAASWHGAKQIHLMTDEDIRKQGNGGSILEPVTEEQYMAMGDNSPNSSDSRMWGAVPEKNVVGPALVVYWPFAPHWGLIR